MGYHPETLAFGFPAYPSGGQRAGKLAKAMYALKPWIGFDIWHIDPERPNTGNRQDDSCGWFDRRAGEYQAAVDDFMLDDGAMQDVRSALGRMEWHRSAYLTDYPESQRGFDMLPMSDSVAVVLMIALHLERRRWWDKHRPAAFWRKPFLRERNVQSHAFSLALNTNDNLRTVDTPEHMVKLIAASLNREFRPWWKHPRWHVHHWQVRFDLVHNLKRMFQRCATCRKRLGFAYCPTVRVTGSHHHSECLGVMAGRAA